MMAYAFNKVDDYFRRGKTGAIGNSLQKGTEGAPAPTAAANTLAKTAETSAEQGNADTNAFRAAKDSNTAAIASSLQQPTQRQAASWGETEQAKANEFLAGGQKKISETYKPLDQQNIGKAESGDTAATNQLTQQLNYKPMEFSPYSVQMPAFEQQQLAGGVGGLQAALQKQRGGRYSQGMAALDASVLAGNRGAMQNLQQGLGNIYQGAREKQATLEQTDENLATQSKTKSEETAKAVRDALQARSGTLQSAMQAKADAEAARLSEASRQDANPNAAMAAEMARKGYSQQEIQGTLANMGQYSAGYNPNAMMNTAEATYAPELDQGYLNLTKILGIAPQAASSKYNTYSVNAPLAQSTAGNAANAYRNANQVFTPASDNFYQGQASVGAPEGQAYYGGQGFDAGMNPDDLLNQPGRA